MKAVGIVGGPRKGQVTDSLVDATLEGLKDRGIETEKLYLYDLDIRPCKGCLACEKSEGCVIEDDHSMVLDEMDKVDIVVFASPTYFSNVTSVAKAFIDRGYSFFEQTRFGPKRYTEKPSKVILITSCGAPFPFSHIMGVVPGSMKAMKAFFKCMNVKIKTLAATGMMEDFDKNSKKCRKLLDKAYSLGEKI